MGTLSMETATRQDLGLIEQTLEGRQEAFQTLVERYQDRMFALVRGYTHNAVEIEDIVQDTFLKAYTKLESFQRQSSFYTWLCRIAINTSLDFLKRHGRSPVQTVEDPDEVAGSGPRGGQPNSVAPDRELESKEIAEITQGVMSAIPEIFRTVLVLREFEEMSYQGIADLLGISIGTVESRLFRARARFKDKLLQLHPEFGRG